MYLKKIIAQGFKSFADKIEIDFDSGLTGVVGPNGSGKSNIVDAVRWVLGEQSVKSLRGDNSMTDVIFSGSKGRSASNTATVTLIFDNSDHYLNFDFNEVSIKRRVYKDGTNEYYLNGEKCRLKDISDILMDTGIAKESFNIISQGKIDEILSSKPTDRRIIFEEAAGVLKYKKRKEEALRKLDAVNSNMERVEDIISELNLQLLPLREQKEKAILYLEKTKKLENLEISLITNDIANVDNKYQNCKKRKEEIENNLLKLNSDNTSDDTKVEKYKNEISKIDEEIRTSQNSLLELTKKVEQINSEKNIILERKKYKVDNIKLHNNILELKENELKLNNLITSLEIDINNETTFLESIILNIDNIVSSIEDYKKNKLDVNNELSKSIMDLNKLNIEIDYLNDNIDTNSLIPNAVKMVLDNPKLDGIYNILGNVIEIDKSYVVAITTILSSNINNVIVKDENSARYAIKYLKINNIGRVTFFPLNIMKPRYIPESVINSIKNIEGYIGIASNLLKYDSTFTNIILNQLGNVIVVDNVDTANKIEKIINNQYRIVTLDGDLFNIGGSITGGKRNNIRSVISLKQELENKVHDKDIVLNKIKILENDINVVDDKIKELENKYYLSNKDRIDKNHLIDIKKQQLNEYNDKLFNIKNELKGTNDLVNDNLEEEEKSILESYYKVLNEKELLIKKIDLLISNKNDLTDELEEYEHKIKSKNLLYNETMKEFNNLEIEINKYDVKLDMLLNSLNENYSLTYEKAKRDYVLEIDADVARNSVSSLKREIKDIGVVNLAALEEYDRVNERYEFLTSQKDDLMNASNTLIDIIGEMDNTMSIEFMKSFKIIQTNFNKVFKELFKGGNADLKLTDDSDILNTGIEIIASPPGKKLTSINLLSGGEKTFTAISLLFAILKSRSVPFCILDEVEAALDEANVDSFGEYIKNLQENTQFILITHKKKTMEYADVLYGITMQESGVSKLVSVKLEEISTK